MSTTHINSTPFNRTSAPVSPADPTPTSPTDAKTHAVWSHQAFDWSWRNPLATIPKKGNDYVTEQWSEEYLISCKKNLGLAKTSLKSAWETLKQKDCLRTAQHLLNAVVVLIKLGISIELGNFLKGVLGALISSGKLLYHSVEFSVRIVFALLLMTLGAPALFCNKSCREFFINNAQEILNSLGFIMKDIVSMVTCVGHAIPSWLPLVILPFCPPASLALLLIKNAAKFTGIFDLLAYGGTAILLYAKAKVAQWSDQNDPTTHKAVEAWKKLKKELHPFHSIEGATLGMYAFHVVMEGISTTADFFAPGSKTIIDSCSYAIQGVAAVALAAVVYHNSRASRAEEARLIPAEEARSEELTPSNFYGSFATA